MRCLLGCDTATLLPDNLAVVIQRLRAGRGGNCDLATMLRGFREAGVQ